MHVIAKAQTESGDFAAALQTAETIPQQDYDAFYERALQATRDRTLLLISTAQAKADDIESALQTASTIKSEVSRGGALAAIAVAEAKAGDMNNALKTAASIQDPSNAIEIAHREIAVLQVQTKDFSGALRTALLVASQNPFTLWSVLGPAG